MALEIFGASIPILVALKLVRCLFSVGHKMYKNRKKRSKENANWEVNIGVGVEDDGDDDGDETELKLMTANLALQAKNPLTSRKQPQIKDTDGSSKMPEESRRMQEKSRRMQEKSRTEEIFKQMFKDGFEELENVMKEEVREGIKQIESCLENRKEYNELSSKLSIVARDVKENSKKRQDASQKEARTHLDDFVESGGEEIEHLDKAYKCALLAMESSSLNAIFAASIITVSAGYTMNAKRISPADAKILVFKKTFLKITEKLEPYWNVAFATITTEGLKAVEFLMDVTISICGLPPENVGIPPLNDGLIQVFGSLCESRPAMLNRYVELGRVKLLSFLREKPLGARSSTALDTLHVSRPEPRLSEVKACRKPAKSFANEALEYWIGLPAGIKLFYHYAEMGLLSDLKKLSDELNANEDDSAPPADKHICIHAAKGGHLDVLQWLRSKNVPWGSEICAAAASEGHLDLLKWAFGNGCLWDERTCAAAACGGHLDLLKWAFKEGCPKDERTCIAAAYRGHREVLQWANEQKFPWDNEVCDTAAFNGHLNVLEWATREKCPWNDTTCFMAAYGGHLKILKWAKGKGYVLSEKICPWAAKGGHLEVLQWARENGCPWDEETCTNAIDKGHLGVFLWARANGCPSNGDAHRGYQERSSGHSSVGTGK